MGDQGGPNGVTSLAAPLAEENGAGNGGGSDGANGTILQNGDNSNAITTNGDAGTGPATNGGGPTLDTGGSDGGPSSIIGVGPPSPLTGCYLLIVLGEPYSDDHKDIILQRLIKGFLSWDVSDCHVDLEEELNTITQHAPEGEEARHGERLIQYASENLVSEILIHPQYNTLIQCMRNLLSSFTRHRHIIHAGYTFAGNGSWILQDGTFSVSDFAEAFQEHEVQRVLRAYPDTITMNIHCTDAGLWSTLPDKTYTKSCKIRINPVDVLDTGSDKVNAFIDYLAPMLVPASLHDLLETSDVVGNIRFSHPTLYVFPGGQGDAALFGINGFNMLVDGGFGRKACFWDFARHLDRLDAVLMTRINNSNINGLNAVVERKQAGHVYPQIGHFFCNVPERKGLASPDGDKDKDPLLVELIERGHQLISNLKSLNLKPQNCYRDIEPINLYHKVGHGTLDMYVISPARDSKEVREFLQKWNAGDQKLFSAKDTKEFNFPIQNLVSICALLVWLPANPEDTITRILFPGSTPDFKILDGLDKIKHLEFMKYPSCTAKSIAPVLQAPATKKALKAAPVEKGFPEPIFPSKATTKSLAAEKDNRIIDNKIKSAQQQQQDNKMKDAADEQKEKTVDQKPPVAKVEAKQKIVESVKEKEVSPKITDSAKDNKQSELMKSQGSEEKSDEADNKEISEKKVEVVIVKPEGDVETAKKDEGEIKTKPKPKAEKPRAEVKPVVRSRIDSKPPRSMDRKILKKDTVSEKKASPTATPKKQETIKATKEIKPKVLSRITKSSPTSTPAKSTKEANNRKVLESKQISRAKREISKPTEKKETKPERKPISRRPRPSSPSKRAPGSPIKAPKPKADIRKARLDKGGTTDSSLVSTPSADETSAAKKIQEIETQVLDAAKQRELDDLKEEQEVVREIEAVFSRDEAKRQKDLKPDHREITDMTKQDSTTEAEEDEEYLIIEKEEVEQYTEDSINEQESSMTKEEEIQKHQRDSQESEKKRKPSAEDESAAVTEEEKDEKEETEEHEKKEDVAQKEELKEDEKEEISKVEKDIEPDSIEEPVKLASPEKSEIKAEVQEIITSAKEIAKAKIEETVIKTEEFSSPTPEDRLSSAKKTSDTKDDQEEEVKETNLQESLPEEKFSGTIESGATTAPTLPEDERIPLDEIKEDIVIEEKYVKEDTKETEVPTSPPKPTVTELTERVPPPKMQFNAQQGILRDIVKTPDEVADLPVHEEAEYEVYDEYGSDAKKKEKEEGKPSDVKEEDKLKPKIEKPESLLPKGDIKTPADAAKALETKGDKATSPEEKEKDTSPLHDDMEEEKAEKDQSPQEEKGAPLKEKHDEEKAEAKSEIKDAKTEKDKVSPHEEKLSEKKDEITEKIQEKVVEKDDETKEEHVFPAVSEEFKKQSPEKFSKEKPTEKEEKVIKEEPSPTEKSKEESIPEKDEEKRFSEDKKEEIITKAAKEIPDEKPSIPEKTSALERKPSIAEDAKAKSPEQEKPASLEKESEKQTSQTPMETLPSPKLSVGDISPAEKIESEPSAATSEDEVPEHLKMDKSPDKKDAAESRKGSTSAVSPATIEEAIVVGESTEKDILSRKESLKKEEKEKEDLSPKEEAPPKDIVAKDEEIKQESTASIESSLASPKEGSPVEKVESQVDQKLETVFKKDEDIKKDTEKLEEKLSDTLDKAEAELETIKEEVKKVDVDKSKPSPDTKTEVEVKTSLKDTLQDMGDKLKSVQDDVAEKVDVVEEKAKDIKGTIIDKVETVPEVIQDSKDKVEKEVKDSGTKMDSGKDSIVEKVKDVAATLEAEVKALDDKTKQDVAEKSADFAKTIEDASGEVVDSTKTELEKIEDKTKAVRDEVKEKATEVIETTKDVIKDIQKEAVDKADDVAKVVDSKAAKVEEQIKDALQNVEDYTKEIKAKTEEIVDAIIEPEKKQLEAVKEDLKEVASKTVEKVEDVKDDIKKTVDKYEEVKTDVSQKIKDGKDAAIEKVAEKTDEVVSEIEDKIAEGTTDATKQLEVVGEKVEEKLEMAVVDVEKTTDAVSKTIAETTKDVAKGIKTVATEIEPKAEKAIEAISTGISSLMSGLIKDKAEEADELPVEKKSSFEITSYTTELRETHITTLDSPIVEEPSIEALRDEKYPILGFDREDSSLNDIKEEEEEDRISPPRKPSDEIQEIICTTPEQICPQRPVSPREIEVAKIVASVAEVLKSDKPITEIVPDFDEKELEEKLSRTAIDIEASTVQRMLVTASSEDGGEETEICAKGSIKFTPGSTPETQSGKISPELPEKAELDSQIDAKQDTKPEMSSKKSTPDDDSKTTVKSIPGSEKSSPELKSTSISIDEKDRHEISEKDQLKHDIQTDVAQKEIKTGVTAVIKGITDIATPERKESTSSMYDDSLEVRRESAISTFSEKDFTKDESSYEDRPASDLSDRLSLDMDETKVSQESQEQGRKSPSAAKEVSGPESVLSHEIAKDDTTTKVLSDDKKISPSTEENKEESRRSSPISTKSVQDDAKATTSDEKIQKDHQEAVKPSGAKDESRRESVASSKPEKSPTLSGDQSRRESCVSEADQKEETRRESVASQLKDALDQETAGREKAKSPTPEPKDCKDQSPRESIVSEILSPGLQSKEPSRPESATSHVDDKPETRRESVASDIKDDKSPVLSKEGSRPESVAVASILGEHKEDTVKSPTPTKEIPRPESAASQTKSPTPSRDEVTESRRESISSEKRSPVPLKDELEQSRIESFLSDKKSSTPPADETGDSKQESALADSKSSTPPKDDAVESRLESILSTTKSPTPPKEDVVESRRESILSDKKSPTPPLEDAAESRRESILSEKKSPTPPKEDVESILSDKKSPTPPENDTVESRRESILSDKKSSTPPLEDAAESRRESILSEKKSPTPPKEDVVESILSDKKSPTPPEDDTVESRRESILSDKKSPTPPKDNAVESRRESILSDTKSPTPPKDDAVESRRESILSDKKSPTPPKDDAVEPRRESMPSTTKSPTPPKDDAVESRRESILSDTKSPTPPKEEAVGARRESIMSDKKSPTPPKDDAVEPRLESMLSTTKSPTPPKEEPVDARRESILSDKKSPTPPKDDAVESRRESILSDTKSPTPPKEDVVESRRESILSDKKSPTPPKDNAVESRRESILSDTKSPTPPKEEAVDARRESILSDKKSPTPPKDDAVEPRPESMLSTTKSPTPPKEEPVDARRESILSDKKSPTPPKDDAVESRRESILSDKKSPTPPKEDVVESRRESILSDKKSQTPPKDNAVESRRESILSDTKSPTPPKEEAVDEGRESILSDKKSPTPPKDDAVESRRESILSDTKSPTPPEDDTVESRRESILSDKKSPTPPKDSAVESRRESILSDTKSPTPPKEEAVDARRESILSDKKSPTPPKDDAVEPRRESMLSTTKSPTPPKDDAVESRRESILSDTKSTTPPKDDTVESRRESILSDKKSPTPPKDSAVESRRESILSDTKSPTPPKEEAVDARRESILSDKKSPTPPKDDAVEPRRESMLSTTKSPTPPKEEPVDARRESILSDKKSPTPPKDDAVESRRESIFSDKKSPTHPKEDVVESRRESILSDTKSPTPPKEAPVDARRESILSDKKSPTPPKDDAVESRRESILSDLKSPTKQKENFQKLDINGKISPTDISPESRRESIISDKKSPADSVVSEKSVLDSKKDEKSPTAPKDFSRSESLLSQVGSITSDKKDHDKSPTPSVVSEISTRDDSRRESLLSEKSLPVSKDDQKSRTPSVTSVTSVKDTQKGEDTSRRESLASEKLSPKSSKPESSASHVDEKDGTPADTKSPLYSKEASRPESAGSHVDDKETIHRESVAIDKFSRTDEKPTLHQTHIVEQKNETVLETKSAKSPSPSKDILKSKEDPMTTSFLELDVSRRESTVSQKSEKDGRASSMSDHEDDDEELTAIKEGRSKSIASIMMTSIYKPSDELSTFATLEEESVESDGKDKFLQSDKDHAERCSSISPECEVLRKFSDESQTQDSSKVETVITYEKTIESEERRDTVDRKTPPTVPVSPSIRSDEISEEKEVRRTIITTTKELTEMSGTSTPQSGKSSPGVQSHQTSDSRSIPTPTGRGSSTETPESSPKPTSPFPRLSKDDGKEVSGQSTPELTVAAAPEVSDLKLQDKESLHGSTEKIVTTTITTITKMISDDGKEVVTQEKTVTTKDSSDPNRECVTVTKTRTVSGGDKKEDASVPPPRAKELSSIKSEIRSSTPGSDEIDPHDVQSPRSDISSGQASRIITGWTTGGPDDKHYSDDEVPPSPLSVTSQAAHSPPSKFSYEYDLQRSSSGVSKKSDLDIDDSQDDIPPQYGSEEAKSALPISLAHKTDPMSTSYYGALPETFTGKSDPIPITTTKTVISRTLEESSLSSQSGDSYDPKWSSKTDHKFLDEADLDFEKALEEQSQLRGAEVMSSVTAKYSYSPSKQVTEEAFAKEQFPLEDIQKIKQTPEPGKSEKTDTSETDSKQPTEKSGDKDPSKIWGKPLGLPSPAPMPVEVDIRTTPKKERKVLLNKNKFNNEKNRKRSESPVKAAKKASPIYMDLTYVPHNGNSYYSHVEFFKRVRARYYVFSGTEPSREVYNALLEAKQSWEDKDLEVTIIPTYDTDVLGYWVSENEELLAKNHIDLSPSASRCTINLQDHETSCSAYRLEF